MLTCHQDVVEWVIGNPEIFSAVAPKLALDYDVDNRFGDPKDVGSGHLLPLLVAEDSPSSEALSSWMLEKGDFYCGMPSASFHKDFGRALMLSSRPEKEILGLAEAFLRRMKSETTYAGVDFEKRCVEPFLESFFSDDRLNAKTSFFLDVCERSVAPLYPEWASLLAKLTSEYMPSGLVMLKRLVERQSTREKTANWIKADLAVHGASMDDVLSVALAEVGISKYQSGNASFADDWSRLVAELSLVGVRPSEALVDLAGDNYSENPGAGIPEIRAALSAPSIRALFESLIVSRDTFDPPGFSRRRI